MGEKQAENRHGDIIHAASVKADIGSARAFHLGDRALKLAAVVIGHIDEVEFVVRIGKISIEETETRTVHRIRNSVRLKNPDRFLVGKRRRDEKNPKTFPQPPRRNSPENEKGNGGEQKQRNRKNYFQQVIHFESQKV